MYGVSNGILILIKTGCDYIAKAKGTKAAKRKLALLDAAAPLNVSDGTAPDAVGLEEVEIETVTTVPVLVGASV